MNTHIYICIYFKGRKEKPEKQEKLSQEMKNEVGYLLFLSFLAYLPSYIHESERKQMKGKKSNLTKQ